MSDDDRLTGLALTQHATLEEVRSLLGEFSERYPNRLEAMIEYEGADGDVVTGFRLELTRFVHRQNSLRQLDDEADGERWSRSISIAGSMVEVAKIIHPGIAFNRVDEWSPD